MKKETSINLDLIIEGCRQGNRLSQNKLYQYFYGYGLSICLRYAKDREQAVEMFNDGFVKIFSKLDQYDSDMPFKPWLRKILIHSAIDYHRKHQHPETFYDWTETEFHQTTEQPQIEENEDVLPYVQALPPAYRMVFNLYVMEGLKHDEIAERLGISAGTSKSNLARAKEKLRQMVLKKRKVLKTNGL